MGVGKVPSAKICPPPPQKKNGTLDPPVLPDCCHCHSLAQIVIAKHAHTRWLISCNGDCPMRISRIQARFVCTYIQCTLTAKLVRVSPCLLVRWQIQSQATLTWPDLGWADLTSTTTLAGPVCPPAVHHSQEQSVQSAAALLERSQAGSTGWHGAGRSCRKGETSRCCAAREAPGAAWYPVSGDIDFQRNHHSKE